MGWRGKWNHRFGGWLQRVSCESWVDCYDGNRAAGARHTAPAVIVVPQRRHHHVPHRMISEQRHSTTRTSEHWQQQLQTRKTKKRGNGNRRVGLKAQTKQRILTHNTEKTTLSPSNHSNLIKSPLISPTTSRLAACSKVRCDV